MLGQTSQLGNRGSGKKWEAEKYMAEPGTEKSGVKEVAGGGIKKLTSSKQRGWGFNMGAGKNREG